MKSFTAHFYEEGKLVGECTAEAADWNIVDPESETVV